MTNPTDIARLLAHHFPGAKVGAVARLTGGVSADVVRVDFTDTDGARRSLVLRIHGASHSGHDAVFEFDLLKALHDAGVRVPEPLFVDDTCRQYPHPYLAMAFVEGSTALENADDQIADIAQMLFAIHQTPTDTLPSLPLRIDPLPEVFEFLPDEAEWGPLRHQLSTLGDTAYEGDLALLHGDFWPENLIWRGGEIQAVLDWEDAALGDPLSDVACTCLELRYVLGTDGADRFRQAYATLADIDPKRLALWQIYVAAAAQKYMGDWRLDPPREAHMRATALQSIRDAARVLAS